MKDILSGLENNIWNFFAIPLLVFLGLYFTVRLTGLQFRKVPLMCKLLGKKKTSDDGISAFQSFSLALAARVGVGSLAGIGLAIFKGGYGAIFWMWLIALLGAASAFVESTLAQLFREKKGNLSYGGTSYYIQKGLGIKWLAIFFAVTFCVVYGLFFPMVQMNSIVSGISNLREVNPLYPTLIVMLVIAVVIIGGAKSIAKVAEIVVPVMAILFVLFGLWTMVANITMIGDFFATVATQAFKPTALVSGGIMTVISLGIRRGIFANEAGMGSGATAAAAADVEYPVESGLTQSLSVLITSIVIGTITAFIIFSSGVNLAEMGETVKNGIELTQYAFSFHFGKLGDIFLLTALILFAFSTILTACYYMESSIKFLTKNVLVDIATKVAIIGCILLGGLWNADLIWSLADLGVAIMASINAVVIFLLFKHVSKITKKELDKIEGKK